MVEEEAVKTKPPASADSFARWTRTNGNVRFYDRIAALRCCGAQVLGARLMAQRRAVAGTQSYDVTLSTHLELISLRGVDAYSGDCNNLSSAVDKREFRCGSELSR
jgi:hypothetical protein